MPMSKEFEGRLFHKLPSIIEQFGTPFHIYDEQGIIDTCLGLKSAFKRFVGFQEFFAVKALPNPHVMKTIHEHSGFGFDCSSIMELQLAEHIDAVGDLIMFTSNNSTRQDFIEAMQCGAIINLDDISLINKIPDMRPNVPEAFPHLICFRYNPGPERTGNSIIGKPKEAKYGITKDQLIPAYEAAQNRGAKRFGIHTMVCSNELSYQYMVATVRRLLELCLTLKEELGICCEFMNMGGGIGIPYKPNENVFDIVSLAEEVGHIMDTFEALHDFCPKLFMESGRYITGPSGVLVSRVINRKEIYETHVGVDTGMEALMRHAMYGAYHHVTILDSQGKQMSSDMRPDEIVNVVGAICENCDRLATQRVLPKTIEGDIVITHDTGAHGSAMGFNYNGRLRPQELYLQANGNVRRIRRAETQEDLWRTLREA